MKNPTLPLFVVLLTVQQLQAAPISVARLGGSGNQAANSVFSSGDLSGSITNLSSGDFNALSVTQLVSTYDVLLFGWPGSSVFNADWSTRLLPYLQAGGGVIWESPSDLGDLAPAISATSSGASVSGITVASVPGLTDGVTNSFINSHITFTSWDPALNPFITNGSGEVLGLYGEFGAGRIVLTGPDQDYHAIRGAGGADGNQYNLLVNELAWVSSDAVSAVPEPTSMALFGLGALGLGGLGYRRRRREEAAADVA